MSAPSVDDVAAVGHASDGAAGDADWLRTELMKLGSFTLRLSFQPGKAGTYQILPESTTAEWSQTNIGSCGQGLVVQVRDPYGQIHALKMAESGTAKEDLEREVKLCATLPDFEHVAMMTDCGRILDRPFHLTPFAEHLNLERYIRELAAADVHDDVALWSVEQLYAPVDWLCQICCGIAFLHFAGVIHCDLKPKNILVYRGGPPGVEVTLKICDLGFAIRAAEYGCISTRFNPKSHPHGQDICLVHDVFDTISGVCHGGGTEGYKAPEYKQGDTITDRVDCWGLSMIGLHIIKGHHAFSSSDAAPEQYRQIIGDTGIEELDGREARRSESARQLRQLILDGLEPQADRRPSSLAMANRLSQLSLCVVEEAARAKVKAKMSLHAEEREQFRQEHIDDLLYIFFLDPRSRRGRLPAVRECVERSSVVLPRGIPPNMTMADVAKMVSTFQGQDEIYFTINGKILEGSEFASIVHEEFKDDDGQVYVMFHEDYPIGLPSIRCPPPQWFRLEREILVYSVVYPDQARAAELDIEIAEELKRLRTMYPTACGGKCGCHERAYGKFKELRFKEL